MSLAVYKGNPARFRIGTIPGRISNGNSQSNDRGYTLPEDFAMCAT
jgi:hypothetical protein